MQMWSLNAEENIDLKDFLPVMMPGVEPSEAVLKEVEECFKYDKNVSDTMPFGDPAHAHFHRAVKISGTVFTLMTRMFATKQSQLCLCTVGTPSKPLDMKLIAEITSLFELNMRKFNATVVYIELKDDTNLVELLEYLKGQERHTVFVPALFLTI